MHGVPSLAWPVLCFGNQPMLGLARDTHPEVLVPDEATKRAGDLDKACRHSAKRVVRVSRCDLYIHNFRLFFVKAWTIVDTA